MDSFTNRTGKTSIFDLPIQWMRSHVRELGTRAAFRALARDRPDFQGAQWIDLRLTTATYRAAQRRAKLLAKQARDHALQAAKPDVPADDEVALALDQGDQDVQPRRPADISDHAWEERVTIARARCGLPPRPEPAPQDQDLLNPPSVERQPRRPEVFPFDDTTLPTWEQAPLIIYALAGALADAPRLFRAGCADSVTCIVCGKALEHSPI